MKMRLLKRRAQLVVDFGLLLQVSRAKCFLSIYVMLISCAGSANTRPIPFYNVLWAEISDTKELAIRYAAPTSKTRVQATELKYAIESNSTEEVEKWIAKLLDRSYGESQQTKRAKVLVNPHSGKGKAQKYYDRDVEPLLKAANCSIDMVKTKFQGDAVTIVEDMDVEAYDMVVCCSGDGLAHEVFNGLGKRHDAKKALSKIAVTHVPCGSGNAMSMNLNGTASASLATLAIIKGIPTPLDLMSITQGETRTISFLSQSVGIVAEADLATEHLRWMGSARFTYGFLERLIGQAIYPCDIAVKVAIEDKPSIKDYYRKEMSNREPASERRGYKHLLDDDASASSGTDDGLPPLRYGTVSDKLPEGWEMVPYDKLGNFYCGNVSLSPWLEQFTTFCLNIEEFVYPEGSLAFEYSYLHFRIRQMLTQDPDGIHGLRCQFLLRRPSK